MFSVGGSFSVCLSGKENVREQLKYLNIQGGMQVGCLVNSEGKQLGYIFVFSPQLVYTVNPNWRSVNNRETKN